jgi:hypothetical protein
MFFQNHRHKSHAITQHFRYFSINLPETSGTSVKLLDNGIIPHNQRKERDLSKPAGVFV